MEFKIKGSSSREKVKDQSVRIMYLIGSLSSGGAERQLVELAKNIDKERYEAFIVIYHNNVHYEYILDAEGVDVICIEKKHKISLSFLWRLVKFIRRNDSDIIHSYTFSTNVWGRLAGRLSGCRIIIPSVRATNRSSKLYFLERLLKRWTSCVIFNSHTAKQEYLENVNIPNKEYAVVIQNGIDLGSVADCLSTSAKKSRSDYGNGIQEDDFIIVCVARIAWIKNQLCLLKAIQSIGIENLKVLFVGGIQDKECYHELQNYIEKHQLNKSIYFLGKQQDVFSIMNVADVLLLTSLRESFPNVIMEAMSLNLPVISSDVGDVRYLVKNGVNGFLFPSNDHQRLSQLILKIYSLDADTRKEMGKAGREIIEANYTIEKMVKKTEAVYETFLKPSDTKRI